MSNSISRLSGTLGRRLTGGARLLALAGLAHLGGSAATVPSRAEEISAGYLPPVAWQGDQREIRRLQPIFQDEMLDLAPAVPSDESIAALSGGETASGGHDAAFAGTVASESGQDWDWDAEGNEAEPVLFGCGHCRGVCRCPGHPAKPLRKMPGDVDRGDCPPKRYRIDQRLRSGDPDSVYKWAQPTYSQKYSAWYVGGGGGFIKGRGRSAQEGTWGLDYGGLFGHAKVWLNYTCNRYQGGEGAYQTEHESLRSRLRHHE